MATVERPVLITTGTLQEAYRQICMTVLEYGSDVSPRGMRTAELLGFTVILERPHCALPTLIGRRVSTEVATTEAVQLCGGFHDPELMVMASEHFEQFREPDNRKMHGAYGNRINTQGADVVRKLQRDPESRQAVITLWDPHKDNMRDKLDYPCTVALQFLIRKDQLICFTDMRSNDVWLGLAYDLFQFGQLQWTIANMLECTVGPLVHRPVSLHAYERDWEAIENLHDPTGPPDEWFGFKSFWRAALLGYGHTPGTNGQLFTNQLTETEDRYMQVMQDLQRRKFEKLTR